MKGERIKRGLLSAMGAVLLSFVAAPLPNANAQTCGGGGCYWTSGAPYETSYWHEETFCRYYYEDVDYYYCGVYSYTTEDYIGLACFG